ncbi:DUF3290 family protein [Enterobacter hormaechei]
MTAHAAEFFTMDKVNRLKIIQDVVVQPLTTLMAAQRLDISERLLLRYNESGPLGMAGRCRGKFSSSVQLSDGIIVKISDVFYRVNLSPDQKTYNLLEVSLVNPEIEIITN